MGSRSCSTIRPATRSSCFSQPRVDAYEVRGDDRTDRGAHAGADSDRARVLFWTYNALNLTPLHMLIGLVVVLALLVLAGLELRAWAHPGLASGAFAGASLSSPSA